MTPQSTQSQLIQGSLDGTGAGDRDVPYVFGRRPRATAPFPFSTRQFARLMVLRSSAQDGLFGVEDCVPATV